MIHCSAGIMKAEKMHTALQWVNLRGLDYGMASGREALV